MGTAAAALEQGRAHPMRFYLWSSHLRSEFLAWNSMNAAMMVNFVLAVVLMMAVNSVFLELRCRWFHNTANTMLM
jgi:hypothetical protein